MKQQIVGEFAPANLRQELGGVLLAAMGGNVRLGCVPDLAGADFPKMEMG